MTVISFVFGLLALIFAMNAMGRVKKLEQKLKDSGVLKVKRGVG